MAKRTAKSRHAYLYIVLTFIFLIVAPGALLSYLGLTTLGQEQIQIEQHMRDEHRRLLDIVLKSLDTEFENVYSAISEELLPAALKDDLSESFRRRIVAFVDQNQLILDAFIVTPPGNVRYPESRDSDRYGAEVVELLAKPPHGHAPAKEKEVRILHRKRGKLLDLYRKAASLHASGAGNSALVLFREIASKADGLNSDIAFFAGRAEAQILLAGGNEDKAQEKFALAAGNKAARLERDIDWDGGLDFPAALLDNLLAASVAEGPGKSDGAANALIEVQHLLLDGASGLRQETARELHDIADTALESLLSEVVLGSRIMRRLDALRSKTRRVRGLEMLRANLAGPFSDELADKLADIEGKEGRKLEYDFNDGNEFLLAIYRVDARPGKEHIATGFALDEVAIRENLLPGLLAEERFPQNIAVTAVGASGNIVAGRAPDHGRAPHLAVPMPHPLTGWKLQVHFRDPEELSRIFRRGKILNIAKILVLLLFLILGVFLVLRIIGREMELARMRASFVSNVSHELKTPLTSIRMFGEMLKLDRVTDEEKRKEYYEVIAAESERLSKLIDNVLDFARLEAGRESYNFAKANPVDVVKRATQVFGHYMKEQDFELRSDYDESVPEIRMDPEAISRAVLNLLSNAVKYSREEDRIIDVSVRLVGEDVRISVRDRGIGLDEEEMEKIFEKFYRSGRMAIPEVSGTGLGLTLVKAVVRAHGGRIDVQSRKGKGSIFTIILPVKGPPPASESRRLKT
ncbi:MAG: sensor histidine kinase [Planctomycetota bacterium]|jgi:signal transduction histidine kinase